jgi:endonuclease/exonuclease/phosphatase family metal-dependent hydrolase
MALIRIVTYNIHRCRGLDRRVSPQRIADVLRDLDADCIVLQEVLRDGKTPESDQAHFIASALGKYEVIFGSNRLLGGGHLGNATLSRLPVRYFVNYNISHGRRERRGCLRADIVLPSGALLHLFNLHLGTGYMERRQQGPKLLSDQILHNVGHTGSRLIAGDFNEWSRGVTSRLMAEHFLHVDPRLHQRRGKTYPGIFPVFHLDHIYYDRALKLEKFRVIKTAKALIASDHLPLVAEFSVD